VGHGVLRARQVQGIPFHGGKGTTILGAVAQAGTAKVRSRTRLEGAYAEGGSSVRPRGALRRGPRGGGGRGGTERRGGAPARAGGCAPARVRDGAGAPHRELCRPGPGAEPLIDPVQVSASLRVCRCRSVKSIGNLDGSVRNIPVARIFFLSLRPGVIFRPGPT